jgi:hypothetical protein
VSKTPEEIADGLCDDSNLYRGCLFASTGCGSDACPIAAVIRSAVEAEREACARALENMIIGGRAWTQDQSIAAEVLGAGADAIRARSKAEDKS